MPPPSIFDVKAKAECGEYIPSDSSLNPGLFVGWRLSSVGRVDIVVRIKDPASCSIIWHGAEFMKTGAASRPQ